jgi:hypothetical protein
MADVFERILPHLESLPSSEILERARNVELFDCFSRRNFGLDNLPQAGVGTKLAIMANQAAVQVVSNRA